MSNQIDLTKLQDKTIFVATPMYGGQCSGVYTKSMNDLVANCATHGINVRYYYLFNESLITRARNYMVDEFLRSDATHLMFIDSDIGFEWKYPVVMLDIMVNDPTKRIVTAPYPKKTIAWEKVYAAVQKGLIGDNPYNMAHYMGDFVFNTETPEISLSEPVKVSEGGTGFMMIERSVFEEFEKAYPELKYTPDHARSEYFDGSRQITAYFDTVIDPDSNRYLSEDYMFCQYVRKLGIDVWMLPYMNLSHMGSFLFKGSLSALAQAQMSPTASSESNQKHYEKK